MNEQPQEEKPRKNRRWVGIAQIVFSAAVLAYLLNKVGLQEVFSELSHIDPGLYALAGIVLLASLAARALRWQVLLTPLGVKVSVLDLFWLYMIGFFWNSFLPSGFGGDVVKAIELRRMTRQGAAAVMSVVAERIVGLLATGVIGLMVIIFRPDLVPPQATWGIAILCAAIILGTWFLRLDILQWIGERVPFLRKIVLNHRLVSLHEALKTYTLKTLGLGFIASIPFTLLSILDNFLVGLALAIPLGIGYYAIYTPIITVINLLPLSFNGLGVREYTYQVLFGLVGVSADQAIAMALAFNLLRFGAGLLGGVVSVVMGLRRASVPEAVPEGDQP